MQKVIRTGNSVAVVIPAKFARLVGIKKGDKVAVDINQDDGKMIISFPHIRQLSLKLSSYKK